MRLCLKINNVEGMDDQKRHILLVDEESLRTALMEHDGWLTQNVIKEWLMKRQPKLLSEVIDDPTLRNVIYMQEKAKREAKGEQRERKRLFEIERKRKEDLKRQSIADRQAFNFYRDLLGIKEE